MVRAEKGGRPVQSPDDRLVVRKKTSRYRRCGRRSTLPNLIVKPASSSSTSTAMPHSDIVGIDLLQFALHPGELGGSHSSPLLVWMMPSPQQVH